jgi:hypothetical protein
MQEKFSNSRQGPEGLSASRSVLSKTDTSIRNILSDDDKTTKSGAVAQSSGTATEPIDAEADESGKRGRVSDEEDYLHTLPYSYDIVPMGISIDMLQRFYDDRGTGMLKEWRKTFTEFGVNDLSKYDDLPQMSTSFVGYEEHNRQSITIKLKSTRPHHQKEVAAGDPDISTLKISRSHVSRSIGRVATDLDIEQWVSRRQGSRSTGRLEGDLFAFSTWIDHTFQSARRRGFACTRNDAVFLSYIDMEHMLFARGLEMACEKGDLEYGRKYGVDFKHTKLKRAQPGTYGAQQTAISKSAPSTKRARATSSASTFKSGSEAAVRETLKTTGFYDDEEEDEEDEEEEQEATGCSSHMQVDSGACGDTLIIGARPP